MNVNTNPSTRRTDEQRAAELRLKLNAVERRINTQHRREDTLRKILLGAGLLRLKDPMLLGRVRRALSEKDQERLAELETAAEAAGEAGMPVARVSTPDPSAQTS